LRHNCSFTTECERDHQQKCQDAVPCFCCTGYLGFSHWISFCLNHFRRTVVEATRACRCTRPRLFPGRRIAAKAEGSNPDSGSAHPGPPHHFPISFITPRPLRREAQYDVSRLGPGWRNRDVDPFVRLRKDNFVFRQKDLALGLKAIIQVQVAPSSAPGKTMRTLSWE
jgi:hypothetical protein